MLHCDTKLIVVATVVCSLVAGQGRAEDLEGTDDFKYPGSIQGGNTRQGNDGRPSDLAKSLQMARQISQLDTVEDFLKLTKQIPISEKEVILSNRFGGTGQRSNAVLAKPAKCEPTPTMVRIAEANRSLIYFPECTRVPRCGGCCQQNLLSCEPTASETINVEVIVTSLADGGHLNYVRKITVALEQHTKCECNCRIKADQECSDNQIYVPAECSCMCRNREEEDKCKIEYGQTKRWDSDNCKCMCNLVHECSTGLYFDHNTCRCREISLTRNWYGSDGTGYWFGQTQRPANTDNIPPIIVPLDATDPRRKPKEDFERKSRNAD